MIYAIAFLFALYLLISSLICVERNDGHHNWCPLCWCLTLITRFIG